MKKQLLLVSGGAVMVAILFFFGRTAIKKEAINVSDNTASLAKPFSIQENIVNAKKNLPPSQLAYLSALENNINQGNVINRQIDIYRGIAAFWKDSAKMIDPYIYYTAEASKLENSEKNLTFAAQLILNNLRMEHDETKINWKADLAIQLFEKAIQLNPNNEDLKIGLGSAYIFGKGRFGSPEETMKGIQEVLVVVRKDSTNMKAQLVLGIGGFISGQFDKAIVRLEKVVAVEPDNLEAIAYLADSYAASGDKAKAIKYYEISKRLYNNPQYSKEVDMRIKQLQ